VADDDRVPPITENSIAHSKKRLRRNVTPMLLMSYIKHEYRKRVEGEGKGKRASQIL